MLRGTEIVYIKFVLKFFKIKNAFCGLLNLCQRSISGVNDIINANDAERSGSLNHKGIMESSCSTSAADSSLLHKKLSYRNSIA